MPWLTRQVICFHLNWIISTGPGVKWRYFFLKITLSATEDHLNQQETVQDGTNKYTQQVYFIW